MSYMCIKNILLSKLYTLLILFLSVSIYFKFFITARVHFRCLDVTARQFG